MALLIRNGLLYTQTARGTIRGDILLDENGILAVAEQVDASSVMLDHIIDADDLHVCPGLIDPHMHLVRAARYLKDDLSALGDAALAAGVTTSALWQGDGEQCIIRHGHAEAAAPAIVQLKMEDKNDDQLRQAMLEAADKGVRLGCEIYGTSAAKRVLALQRETDCDLVLVHLTDCGDMLGEIVASGCPVILGACCRRGTTSAYELAAKLQRAGVTVAMTGDYPSTRLHHLPISAGLCVKEGLSAEEALRMITIDAAKLLGVDGVAGTIEPGKRADLTLFDGNPMMLASARVITVSGGELL
ncbi:MAG: amidohydrolase family protein [Christensenellaceae bacterium]|nr:amidohydrolase family protein [Christensenellaceae bacterium]